jgi:hypothetical protein
MLKIKDNVDLKELEKFGFIYKEEMVKSDNLKQVIFNGYYKPYIVDCYMYMIDEETREIELPIYELDTLYKLIKADLVEEVSNE